MKAPKAFTLIELLVVIAIIALLMAILMPVLGKVKDRARATVCLSNQHQIGVALIAYTQSNDGTVTPTVNWKRWHAKNGFYTWGGQIFYEENLVDESSLFHCPASKMPPGYSKKWKGPVEDTGAPYAPTEDYPSQWDWEPRYTYGLRPPYFNHSDPTKGELCDNGVNLDKVKHPQSYFLMADISHVNFVGGAYDKCQAYLFDSFYSFYMYHSNRTNVLHADGSVAKYKEEEITPKIKPDSELWPFYEPPFIYPDGRQSGQEFVQ